jgi:hypothetical protein
MNNVFWRYGGNEIWRYDNNFSFKFLSFSYLAAAEFSILNSQFSI